MITLMTDRLLLRGWRDDDLDTLADLNADPEVMRYIRDGSVRDRQQSAEGLQGMIAHWDKHGFGLFAIEPRDTGKLIGWAGLAMPDFLPEVLPAVEIGWRLNRESWGQGYATEAAVAALRFGIMDCNIERVVSIRAVQNERSARVMEKIGLTYEFDTVVPENGRPVSVHGITRSRYLESHAAS